MTRIAVLVSGGGTNLQALIDAQRENRLGGGEIACVIASRPGVYALERAREVGIEAVELPRKGYSDAVAYSDAILGALMDREIGLVVLAGFLSILEGELLRVYDGRILNVHPSLIPSFCGPGQYGLKVHEAALKCGVKVTGATVHLVNGVVDGGEILMQKAVEVLPGDTPETLQRRVMEQAEWELLPRAVAMLCERNKAENIIFRRYDNGEKAGAAERI